MVVFSRCTMSAEQSNDRQTLLDSLLSAVKSSQVRFGAAKGQLATQEADEVIALCDAFERVLAHGAKSHGSFWPFLKGFLSSQDLERFYLLKNVNTDVGRCRSWLRAALNEHGLERYLLAMVSGDRNKAAETHYESWAFLRDQERSTMLPSMAAGVSSILFAFNIDQGSFNHDSDDSVFMDSASTTSFASAKSSIVSQRSASRKKSLEQQILIGRTRDKSKKGRRTAGSPAGRRRQSSERVSEEGESDSASTTSYETNKSKRTNSLIPMQNSNVIGDLIPVNPISSPNPDVVNSHSEDSTSVRSLGEESDYASACLTLSEEPLKDNKKRLQSVSAVSREDLKKALLSTMERKEQLQQQVDQLKESLTNESEACANLKEEMNESQRKSREERDKLNCKAQNLSRENELLKHQLRKYVGAVQKLREGPQAYETLAQLDLQKRRSQDGTAGGKYVDYHYEASEYEKKLIYLAEMHGELIEFNERLQKSIAVKDAVIQQMRDELVQLRGPLPDESNDDEEANNSIPSSPSHSQRALLHIWIPSVFLSSGGANGRRTHHVYQVYLRIRDEEWNIYRRYSDFYALHSDLKREEPLVETFDFPPKKTVGYKAERVVEERRKRLQSYLRQISNLLVQSNPSLSAKPSKDSVVLLLPFFGEKRGPPTTTRQRHNRSQSQPRSIFSRRSTSSMVTSPQLAM